MLSVTIKFISLKFNLYFNIVQIGYHLGWVNNISSPVFFLLNLLLLIKYSFICIQYLICRNIYII